MNHQKIIISCDTTIAMTKEEIKKNGLYVIPLNTIADGVEYHDTVDIDASKLCELMRNGAKISTSTPTIVEIENYFDSVFAETNADVIIHFTISSKLSSMYSLFTTICKEKYGNKVKVVDSLSICQWMANQVLYAKMLVQKGYDTDEIIQKVQDELIGSEDCVFVPESLEHLKRGGRINPAVASIANFIGVLPILTFRNGEVGKKGVTRTMQKAFLNAYRDWNEKIPELKENYKIIVLCADKQTKDKVNKAELLIQEYTNGMDYIIANLSLNVTAHTGPGTIGFGIIKNYKK